MYDYKFKLFLINLQIHFENNVTARAGTEVIKNVLSNSVVYVVPAK